MFDIFKKIFKRPKGDAAAQESPEHILQPTVAPDTGPEAAEAASALTPPPSALASTQWNMTTPSGTARQPSSLCGRIVALVLDMSVDPSSTRIWKMRPY